MTFGPPLDPPEGPEPCRWHPWDEDNYGPMPDECPECIAIAEDARESAEDERRAERRHGIY